MVIRFAHETNGTWYPWCARGTVTSSTGTPAPRLLQHPGPLSGGLAPRLVAVREVGANDARCGRRPRSSNGSRRTPRTLRVTYRIPLPRTTRVPIRGLGGLSSYAYGSKLAYTFAHTFQASFENLADLTTKPVYVAETGAAQRRTTPGAKSQTFATAVDYTRYKVLWTQQTLREFLLQGLPVRGAQLPQRQSAGDRVRAVQQLRAEGAPCRSRVHRNGLAVELLARRRGGVPCRGSRPALPRWPDARGAGDLLPRPGWNSLAGDRPDRGLIERVVHVIGFRVASGVAVEL